MTRNLTIDRSGPNTLLTAWAETVGPNGSVVRKLWSQWLPGRLEPSEIHWTTPLEKDEQAALHLANYVDREFQL